ncbi:MAG: hypothetical protein IJ613_12010 [Muribaculaceae bacterium]|nr:hypothetical protein [Muribaculaceae bacterium]
MKKMIMMAMMVAMVATLSAQTNVKRAYESLKQSGCINGQRNSNSTDKNGKCNGLLEICQFKTTDWSSQSKVNDLIEAFKTDSGEAYSYVYHKAGDTRQRYAIYYDASNSEVIGESKDLNYILLNVMDPTDESGSMRYCYALEWKDDGDGNLTGRALKTYAPKPSKSRKPYVLRIGDKEWSTEDLDSLPKNIRSTQAIKAATDSLLVELKDLLPDSLESAMGELGEQLGKATGMRVLEVIGDLGDIDANVLSGNDNKSVSNDVEWLTSFNHYRNAFKRAAARESSSAASYATSILKLCKKKQNAGLTDGELNLCRKSIKELQKLTKDEFVKGLLDEAIRYLK